MLLVQVPCSLKHADLVLLSVTYIYAFICEAGLEEAAFEESRTLAGLENAHHNQTFETSNFEGLA